MAALFLLPPTLREIIASPTVSRTAFVCILTNYIFCDTSFIAGGYKINVETAVNQ